MSRRGRLVRFWAAWWLAGLAVWLLLTSTVSLNEVLTGVVAAAVAASVGTATRSASKEDHGREQVSRSQLESLARAALVLPQRTLADTWQLIRALWRQASPDPGRRASGACREVSLGVRIQESPLYETLSTILASLAPNHVLLEIDWQRRVALVHQLVPQERETLDQVMRQS